MKCMSLVVGEERVEGGGGGEKGGCWGELELQRTPEFTFLLLEAGEITQGNHRAPLLLYTFSYFSRFYLENHHQGERGQLGREGIRELQRTLSFKEYFLVMTIIILFFITKNIIIKSHHGLRKRRIP